MANITQALGAEIVLPTTTGTATSFGEARIVRLVAIGVSATISVVSGQSGTGIGSFTMTANTTEYLQKEYDITDHIKNNFKDIKKIRKELKTIKDLEKFYRKIILHKVYYIYIHVH